MLEQVIQDKKIIKLQFQNGAQNHTNCFNKRDVENMQTYARQQPRCNPVTVGGDGHDQIR